MIENYEGITFSIIIIYNWLVVLTMVFMMKLIITIVFVLLMKLIWLVEIPSWKILVNGKDYPIYYSTNCDND